jgi:heme/copper-type cytochrome/quinol oxidase subunit 2
MSWNPQVRFLSAAVLILLLGCGGEAPPSRPAPPQSSTSVDAGRQWTLWMLLIILPLIALVTGCATLLRNWNEEAGPRHAPRQLLTASRADAATLFIAAMMLAAGGVLARVAVHMLSN